MNICTVTGEITRNQLGVVAPHEHIFIDMSVFFTEPEEISAKCIAHSPVTIEKLGILKRNNFAILDNVQLIDYETQKKEIMEFRYAGGNTVVDASNHGLGRDPDLLRRISIDTGLNVIAGSGYYVASAQDKQTLQLSVQAMEENIVCDLTEGIGHSGVKAGIIGEIGINWDFSEFEIRSLTAACRAQKRTGAPLMVHINPWCTKGLDALQIINAHKVAPTRVVICHSDVQNNEDYVFKLLDSGVYVEFDNFGKENNTDIWDIGPGNGRFISDWERVKLIKKIIDRGYIKQLLFSCDICLKTLLHTYGGWGYDHVLTHILPMLKEIGITDNMIRQILVENPASWLSAEE